MLRWGCLSHVGMGLLCVGLAGCNLSDINRQAQAGLTPSAHPVTVETQVADSRIAWLGAKQHPRILATYGGEYNNAGLERMVAKIVGKLAAISGNPDGAYRITILNSPSINAFALPGGYVYVTRGLLALANDSSEVAAVIAHEMAHVTARHGLLRQEKQARMEVTATVVGQILGDRLGEQETQMRSRLSLAQFSRNQELQADQIGIKTVADAGYDPFAASRFLLRMEAYNGFRFISGATDSNLDFLATHPTTPQRVKLTMSEARRLGAPGVGTRDRDAFLGGIDGMIYGDTAEEGYIRGKQFIHPHLGVFFRVPEGFVLDNSKAAVVAQGSGQLAIRFDSVALSEDVPTPLDYIKSGWVTGLEAGRIHGFELNGLPAAMARAQNEKWQFTIVVIMAKKRAFRFLTAAPLTRTSREDGSDIEAVSNAVVNSFRLLTQGQIAALKPLRLRVITVGAGDNVATMAARMRDIDNSQALFRLLNGLEENAVLTEGDRVKIISE